MKNTVFIFWLICLSTIHIALGQNNEAIYYTLKKGETVWAVSVKHKISTTDFRKWNNLKDNNIIPGQQYIVGYKQGADPVPTIENEDVEKNTAYKTKILQGNKAYNQGDLKGALIFFQDALAIKPNEEVPRSKIEEITKEINEAAEENKLLNEDLNNLRYSKTIQEGDSLLKIENYTAAKFSYERAVSIKPAEAYPKNRIIEIDNILNNEKLYRTYIDKGDSAYTSVDYSKAKIFYGLALEVKPNDSYSNERLESIRQIEENAQKQIQEQSQQPTDTISQDSTKKQVKTWWFEISYTLIPASDKSFSFNTSGHGVDMMFDIPLRNQKDAVAKIFPSLGFGGGFSKKTEKSYEFPEVTTDIITIRYYGNALFGLRFISRRFGFTPRIGYNYTYHQLDYKNIPNCVDCNKQIIYHYNRLAMEGLFHVPFSGKRSNFGLLLGAKFLFHPRISDAHLFMIKTGLTF